MVTESSELHWILEKKNLSDVSHLGFPFANLEIQDGTSLSSGGRSDSNLEAQAEAISSVKTWSLERTGIFAFKERRIMHEQTMTAEKEAIPEEPDTEGRCPMVGRGPKRRSDRTKKGCSAGASGF